MPSLFDANRYFYDQILPRRIRDYEAERLLQEKYDKRRVVFRKVQPDDDQRGELYPFCTAGIKTFSQFGIGIGLYFYQLLILCVITFVCALVLTPIMQYYNSNSYGSGTQGTILSASSVCASNQTLTATVGCGNNETTCLVNYRPDCELQYTAILSDLAMSVIFCGALLVSRFAENQIIEELDEAVQTASDYSVQVTDPPKDADDPDEWYEYFSRFGQVRYITVFRNNEVMTTAMLHLHLIERKIAEFSHQKNEVVSNHFHNLIRAREAVRKQVLDLCKEKYRVRRVYCTFELEEHQRLCLQDLEVPDINAILNIKDFSQARRMFRESEVLNVKEPPEPENILWRNLSVTAKKKLRGNMMSILCSIAILVIAWFMIKAAADYSTVLSAFVIAFVDFALPVLFESLTNITRPHDEGQRLSVLQLRLFAARLLITTLVPYFQSAWSAAVTPAFVSQIVQVQLLACFFSPFITLLDVGGIVKRNIIGPLFSETQKELNEAYWQGSEWSLAEKYTGIAKIIFVSVYYALLTPFSLVFACFAFFFMFMVERFLFLRRYKSIPPVDEKIAVLLRQEVLLAVAAHMYITNRYIYSWPMDQTYILDDGTITKVDKYPTYAIWTLGTEPWQTQGQQLGLRAYQIATLIVVIFTLYTWVLYPAYCWVLNMFFTNLKVVGQTQGLGFSELDHITVYEPLVIHGQRRYQCSCSMDMLPRHRPFVHSEAEDSGDLSVYVPEMHRKHVLSVVKYYGDEGAETGHGQQKILHDLESMKQAEVNTGVAAPTRADYKYVTNRQTNKIELVHNDMQNVNYLMDRLKPREVELVDKRVTSASFGMMSSVRSSREKVVPI